MNISQNDNTALLKALLFFDIIFVFVNNHFLTVLDYYNIILVLTYIIFCYLFYLWII